MATLDIRSNTHQALIREIESLVAEFKRLLDEETAFLEVRNREALSSLGIQKQQLLSRLQLQEPFLIQLFTEQLEDSSIRELKQQLEHCRELNRKNQTVALIELHSANKSLELLRSLLKMDDLPLYGSAGQISVKREQRDFGSA